MDDLLRDFLTESSENLARLDNDLIALERQPGDATPLNSVFRTIHTIKGTCGFLGLTRLETLAHSAENLLDALRSGKLSVSDALINDVLAAVDQIKNILEALESTEAEPDGDDLRLIAQLDAWMSHDPTHAATTEPEDMPEPRLPNAPAQDTDELFPTPSSGGATMFAPDVAATGEPTATRAESDAPVVENRAPLADSTLRVSVGLLDELMNLVGELALSRNQLAQLAAGDEQSVFTHPVQHLNRVTTDLLDAVLRTRMQPIGNAWTKLPRLVRDLSSAAGKQIELVMEGADTELDRQILQAIQDPLTHMVRNSADHGIEDAPARRAAGKPEQGTVRLAARHEGGHVIIEIADDGRGIDVSRVRRKAIERGLVRADLAETLSDTQVLRFIFEPGFSTAEQITNVSGRGVGMDVVRSNIEAIGGSVELQSEFGRGATVRIRIPLTLAIISALIVESAGESFAVPQIGIVELVRVTEEKRQLVERVNGARFYRLRDVLLPLVDLHGLLELEPRADVETQSIVVCQVGHQRFGLMVDEVFDTAEIVVKPVGRLVKHLSAYAGCTITGDGRVIMILDPSGVASMAAINERSSRDESALAAAKTSLGASEEATESILLFDAGFPAMQAVPLSLVARLEEFAPSVFEEADGQFLVQYRGALIPVIPANPSIDIRALDPRPVIMFNDGERTMGVAVNAIRDIVEEKLSIERSATRAGVLGVCVINGKATEVIDTDYFLRLAYADWHRSLGHSGTDSAAPHVLLIDDSRFFLGLLAPALRAAGFHITTASGAESALARLDAGETFDLVISDIEMDGMDGFALAEAIRRKPLGKELMLVALTSRDGSDDYARGIAAGFDAYLPKYDRETVVSTVRRLTTRELAAA